jgi:hypothetical protein
MAAANESQGLKIAVAVFVSLTVILSVTAYFLYSNYSQTYEKMVAADAKASTANKAATDAIRDNETLRKRAGYEKVSEIQPLMDAIKKDQDKLGTDLDESANLINQMVSQSQSKGANSPAIASLRQQTTDLIQNFRSEPNVTFASSLERMGQLVRTQAQLVAAYSLDNIALRDDLTSVNQVNQEKLGVQETAAKKARDDNEQLHGQYDEQRQALVAKVDALQTQNTQLASENDTFKKQLAQREEEYNKQVETITNQLKYFREQTELKENALDVPDGRVISVDWTKREVRLNITRNQGAREQMIFAVFDKNAPGIPTDKPKGTIQLTEVGPTMSVGKILRVQTAIEPIRANDIIYSAAWSPNDPKRFALIGKIDMNRDGKDDRADLIRLIQAAGGIIEYDLPPPNVGRETGDLTGRCEWYILDDRDPIRNPGNRRAIEEITKEDTEFNTKRTEAMRKARLLGVRPQPIERLLASLGYSYGMAIPGRTEAINQRAIEGLLNKTQRATPPANANEDEGAMPK